MNLKQAEKMPGVSEKVNNCSDDNINTNTTYKNQLVESEGIEMSVSNNEFWLKHHDNVSYYQLQKFWCGLNLQARRKLLRIDKHTLFEHARKNMYCFMCNGLLLEGFSQIAMYGKSLQKDECMENGCHCQDDDDDDDDDDDVYDPTVHKWGGLSTARDGTLTLLDRYLYSNSLKGVQNVFDSARARGRERQLLYRNACGGYGRGHGGTRETCGLHTAKLSAETLADFWSAHGEETKRSVLMMKEEDFIERLTHRFDRKKFCKDCRRNVTREVKELKELKRTGKEHHCTSWFCPEDTAFEIEVSYDTIGADWHKTVLDSFETYRHFEWGIGNEEGKCDILEFENVGLSVRVKANGLKLSDVNDCYITVRAWKMDGHCNELCVKAYALHSPHCIHSRLVVSDGFVMITFGESIESFFEHAEKVEEEDHEDDFPLDKDGNKLDGECSRLQKHAKNPERAREFLLDSATVIFKEKVEKAFREGTARENAHSMFVCLALKLLEERLHVACKDIVTLEKQMKLLEEEEKEKREEEERKERKRTKEREKKLRRKEKQLREKENKETECTESNEDSSNPVVIGNRDSISETGNDAQLLTECFYSNMEEDQSEDRSIDGNLDWNTSFKHNRFKKRSSRRKGDVYEARYGAAKSNTRINGSPKLGGKKFECPHNRVWQPLDSQKKLWTKSPDYLKKVVSEDPGELTLDSSISSTSCDTVLEDQNKTMVSSSLLPIEAAPCNESIHSSCLSQSNYCLFANGFGYGLNGKPRKMDEEINGFSLFHFGGPVALSKGFEADPISFEGVNPPHKDFIEEYHLFAASNVLEFSIF